MNYFIQKHKKWVILTRFCVVLFLCISLTSCGSVAKKPGDNSSETQMENLSEEAEEESYLSGILPSFPPAVESSKPLHISKSYSSFQWIRSVAPDLDMYVRAQPENASLYTPNKTSLYALTNSAILKTNATGEKEWSLGYWRDHEVLIDGFLDGIRFEYLQFTPEGNIVVAGSANSNELSSPTAWQSEVLSTSARGKYVALDGFLACYSPRGDLLWSTYIGGSKEDGVYSLSVHNDGIYLVGWSRSPDFYARLTNTEGNVPEFFLMKFSFSGELLWEKTYLPSGNYEIGYTYIEAIESTKTGLIVLCTTDNKTLPLIAQDEQTYQSCLTQSEEEKSDRAWEDYYLLYIDLEGTVTWSTYLGGSSVEYLGTATETPNHNVPKLIVDENTFCVVGETISIDYPLRNPLQDTVYSGKKPLSEVWLHTGRPPGCPVITCFSFTGEMLWSTYFGGPPLELTDACMKNGQVYLSGTTEEPVAPVVSSDIPFDSFHEYGDGLLAQIDSNGELLWSTYFGGDKLDTIDAITVEDGTIYFTGTTHSSCFRSETKKSSVQDVPDKYYFAMYTALIVPNTPDCKVHLYEVQNETFLQDPDAVLTSSEDTTEEESNNHRYMSNQTYDICFFHNQFYTIGVLKLYDGVPDYYQFFKEYEEMPPEAKGVVFLARWDID